MALINCPECGKEISDKSEKCVNCGYPLDNKENSIYYCKSCDKQNENGTDYCVYCGNRLTPYRKKQNTPNMETKRKKNKSEFQIERLIVGIVMIVFSFPVLLQSCAAGIVNISEQNYNSFDGSIGFFVFLCMVIFGIISIATRKTKSYIFLRIIATISCAIFISISCLYDGIYKDLKIWGYLFAIYSIIFTFASKRIKEEQ